VKVGLSRIAGLAPALLFAGLVGAAAAFGLVAALGDLGHSTTTVRMIPAPVVAEPAAFAHSKALSINDIYRTESPGVVQVTSTAVVHVPTDPFFGNPFGLPATEQQQALGSGFVIDKAGHIVTNYHVVQGARSVRVSFSDNESLKARIVGVDPSTDVAVLKVDASSRALTPLPLGNSDDVRVGDSVVAIGNPFGLDRTVTSGIVSALQRPIQAPNGFTIDHVIQTDAALNHGNSGGPLINAQGNVIGVNSQIETGSTGAQGNVGVGFAVPINTVKSVVAQLIRNGRVEHAFLGVSAKAITPQLSQIFRLPVTHGLLVQAVVHATAAAKAGLRAGRMPVVVAGESYRLGGDVIVRADGAAVGSLDRLRDTVAAMRPGETLQLEIYRGAKKLTLNVKLGRQPVSAQG
jgi:S1-C subfamily serine protease